MGNWLLGSALALVFILLATALFFFVLTRGALLMRAGSPASPGERDHVYPIYSNMRLIKLIDHQPIITAILLFQYDRLVAGITDSLAQMDLKGKQVLITSCAFGNVVPRVVEASVRSGVERVKVVDIIENELLHAQSKLGQFAEQVELIQGDATALALDDAAVAANVIFFLLHELPDEMKAKALDEAARVLEPGGRLLIAAFHRPSVWWLRVFSWAYFKVFEPYGLALWGREDPVNYLQSRGKWSCERSTCLFGNFQVITATKLV